MLARGFSIAATLIVAKKLSDLVVKDLRQNLVECVQFTGYDCITLHRIGLQLPVANCL
jgi:hypothetical protein